jgi:hypothetical protein
MLGHDRQAMARKINRLNARAAATSTVVMLTVAASTSQSLRTVVGGGFFFTDGTASPPKLGLARRVT